MAFNVDDYVDVAERISAFYTKFPDGRLTRLGSPEIMTVGEKLFVVYTARAYRTPDDPVPAIGTAWEPFPGPTQFTRDSELMNAETAAWGRAIVAVGIGAKRIASREEVEARQPAKPKGPPIGETGARVLLEEARTIGIHQQRLQLAASHVAGRSVEPDVEGLSSLSNDEAVRLSGWLKEKGEATNA